MRLMERIAEISLLLVVGCVLTAGCAQNTETPGDQRMVQDTTTPTWTEQDAETRGNEYYVTFCNGPEKRKLPPATTQPVAADERGDFIRAFGVELDPEEEKAVEDAGVVYVQCNNTVTITSGDNTPSMAGTTTGTATAAQTPSMTQTVSPTQEVPARVGITGQAAFTPGGIADMQGTGSAGEGDTSSEKTSENILTRIEAVESALEKLTTLMSEVLTRIEAMRAGTQPATE